MSARWRLILLIALFGCAVLALGGCVMGNSVPSGQSTAPSQGRAAYEFVAGTIPDDYQVQVARELGCPEADIKAMLKDGMELRDYANIVPAADMLKAMEKRYSIDFKAEWVNSGASWSLGCVAEEGPNAGDTFTVEAYEQSDGSVGYADDYYCAYRGSEYEKLVAGVVEQAMASAGVGDARYALSVSIPQKVSHSVPLDEPLEGSADEFHSNCYVVFYGVGGPDETQGNQMASALVSQFQDKAMQASFYLAYYPNCANSEEALGSLQAPGAAWSVLKSM